MSQNGLGNMAIGAALAAVGIIVTTISYSSVSQGGGRYVVAWGAIAVGAWRFVLGLIQLMGGSSGAPATAAGPSVMPSSATVGASPMGPSGAMSGELSTAMRVIGVLLIALALVRLGFLANLLLRVASALPNDPMYLLQAVVLPGLIGIGSLVAGGLILARSAAARGFGLVFCTVALLYQSYGLVGLIMAMSRNPTFPLAPTTMVLIPANFAILIAGLAILARAPENQVQT